MPDPWENRFLMCRAGYLFAVVILTCALASSVFGQESLPPPRILLGPPDVNVPPPSTGLILPPVAPAPSAILSKNWCGEVELGINGADGNSENHKLRTGGKVKYATDRHVLTSDIIYTLAQANGTENENRGITNTRLECLLPNTPWSIFQTTFLEYDEFKNFDLRLALHTGMGYDWYVSEKFKLKTRTGAGGSWEFGGPDNRFKPEAVLGVDFEKQLSPRQKIIGTIDLFPDINQFGEYRAIAKISYELLIDPTWNLCLRLGALDRYDSTPEGRRDNDVDYYATLLWKF